MLKIFTMKKKILILILAIFGIAQLSFGQEYIRSVDSVQIKSDTAYLEVTYDNRYNGTTAFDGIVGYQFTVVNYVDTVELIVFEGSQNGTNYVPIDSLVEPLNGNYKFSDTPIEFKKYRLGIYGASEDTATLKNNSYYDRYKR